MLSTEFEQQLDVLRGHFKEQLAPRLAAMQALAQQLVSASTKVTNTLYVEAHNLAGTAGTYGANEIGTRAKELEHLLKPYIAAPEIPTAVITQINTTLDTLQALARHWLPNTENVQLYNRHNNYSDTKIVYVSDDDILISERIELALQPHGYVTQSYTSMQSLIDACMVKQPDALIVDMVFLTGSESGAIGIQHLKSELHKLDIHLPPVIFLSVRDDIESRYAANKSGGDRYLTKPVNDKVLIDTLNELTYRTPDSPYKLMIVDTDQAMIDFYNRVLANEPVEIVSTCVPKDTFTLLNKFRPDLLILDINMPDYTGLELATLIRQDQSFSDISIVFISAEERLDKQLHALKLGGDDYIIKPLAPEFFLDFVITRLRRSRLNKEAQDQLKSTMLENEYRRIAIDKHAIVSVTDPAGKIVSVNNKFIEISGYTEEELIGQDHRIINSHYHERGFFQNLWATISSGTAWSGVICNKMKNGELYWVNSTIVPFLSEDGKPYQYVSIRTDITQLVEQQQALNEAIEKAEQANKAKSLFLSNMSHELRTPLNAISGFAQLLQLDIADPYQLEEISHILKASDYLLELIKEVLDLSKIEAGRIDLSIEAVDIRPVLMDCLETIAPLTDDRGISLRLFRDNERVDEKELDAIGIFLRADRVRLKQVMLNLLSNAIKYNRQNGSIDILCEHADDNTLRITIKDTGLGISASNLQHLFRPFNRLNQDCSGIEGTGIGLAITKNLVELMGGSIAVESSLNIGSSFSFTLPIEAEPQHQHQIDLCNILQQDDIQGRHLVLYIEDNPANIKLVSNILARLPYIKFITAPDAMLGISLAETHLPDLILLDINLPGMSGHDALLHLKQTASTAHIPVIGISANAMPSDIERARHSGFTDYLTKPLNIRTFLNVVSHHLQLPTNAQ